ncbi:MAG: MBOAT family O-acyltransferase, partial [Bacteroidales bacterium]
MNSLIDSIETQKIIDLFIYNPKSPLIFSSGFFLFLFTVFVLLYFCLKNTRSIRILYVTLFSLFFYYKSSGVYFLLLILCATSDFFIGQAIHKSQAKRLKQLWITLSLMINLGLLAYFKYTNFLAEIFSGIFRVPFDIERIFLPVGISFFTFQSISYVIDIYRKEIKPLNRWIDYVFYISFFPQLVAGPIVRAKDFIPQIRKDVFVSKEMFGRGVFLIISGLFKKAVISDYISLNFVDRVFDQPVLYSGLENLIAVYGYALQIYCDFSGYSDMAIGIALLLGFHFNENFDSPYKSATITEFWRRWHISLSSWLKDYLYISLGGNRKGRVRTYFNLLTTMLLG